jgi:F-type H+-transporting ATPase subunit delta
VISSRVVKRYAKALFEAGLETKKLESIDRDIETLQSYYEEVEEFRNLIQSPTIQDQTKQKYFQSIFKDEIDPITLSFMSLLFMKSREYLLIEILHTYRQLVDLHRGIVRGEVHSVISLNEKEMNNLKLKLDQITKKNVVLTQYEDKSLLGGFLVKINDQVIDSSLKSQLEKLHRRLIQVS